MAKQKKEFKAGAYGVCVGFAVAVVLVLMTIFAFTTRYTAFSPEKVAKTYTDTIVQTGDGYNAYKNTLVSKNQKFGSFVTNAYMLPYVNKDAEKNKIIGSGSDEEAQVLDQVYNLMYDYYLELLDQYGLDDYNSVFSQYFAKLSQVRKEYIKDEYMDTEFMFSVFESNVQRYGEYLTGTKKQLAQDKKTVIKEETEGVYQKMFGKDYALTTRVSSVSEFDSEQTNAYAEEFKNRISTIANSGETKAELFGLEDTTKEKKILFIKKTKKENNKSDMISAFSKLDCADSIDGVAECTVDVEKQDGTVVATATVYVVKIGNSWYVDNTNTKTDSLYLLKQNQ